MPQAFSVDDLYLHQRITELHCTDSRQEAAAVVRSVDRESDGYLSCIWSFPLDGGAPRQLTHGPGQDTTPRWSPDGSQLAFVSNRGGTLQLYLLPRAAGEARQIGQFEGAPSAIRWSPEGKTLYVTAAVDVDPDWRGARGSQPPPRGPKAPEVAWKLPYKSDGVGYLLAREMHLFALDVRSGDKRRVTDGSFDVLGFDVSPNGRHLAYTRTRDGVFAHATDLWVCDADGSRPRQLTQGIAMVAQPLWSPDGRWILFSGAQQEGDASAYLWLVEFATGKVSRLGDDTALLASPEAAQWTADGAAVCFARMHRGRHQITRITVPGGEQTVLVDGDRQLGAVGFTGMHLVYSVDTPVEPSELHCSAADGSGERRVSDLNPWWRDRTPMTLHTREFRVPDGRGGTETIQGWLLHAQGAKGPMPLLNDVHGGPAAYVQLDYDTNVFWQVLCAQGWAVLALDAVGSAGYGREFMERLQGHWGEYDLPQHLEAVRQLQAEGMCDERIAVSGKSYGGFLSGWAIGHTEAFRAAIVMAPVGNIETHYGTSDGGYYADPLYVGGAGPMLDRQRARELSPLQYVERARTPTLFLQGKDDERCPKCQSEELFVSMVRAGHAPAELVLYPGEDHHFLGEGAPSVRADAARRIIDWLKHHTLR